MNAIQNQATGAMGMLLTGFGLAHAASGAQRSSLVGISTALGSAAMLASFYNSHKFKREDGQYNYANIAMTAFMALSLTAFNIIYWIRPSGPPPDFCDTYPTHKICQQGQP